jgi:hypothetical protein
MAKKSAIAGEYILSVLDSGSIEVYRIYDNVKGALREVAEKEGFEYDTNWTTRQLGSKLIDYLIEKEWDADGDWGKTRALYVAEKEKFKPLFRQIDPNINMNYVRLVEFCWYNGCEADDYYDETIDSFYKSLA